MRVGQIPSPPAGACATNRAATRPGGFDASEQRRKCAPRSRVVGEAADRHGRLDQIATTVVELVVSGALRTLGNGRKRHGRIVHPYRRPDDAVEAVIPAGEHYMTRSSGDGGSQNLAGSEAALRTSADRCPGVVKRRQDLCLPLV